MKHDQLKQDIAEWQLKADKTLIDEDPDCMEDRELIEEARTLLLRASESL